MSEYKAPKFGYIDSDGKFIALDTDSITSTPITSLNIGSRMTAKPSYDTCVTNRDYTAMAYTKAYIDKYVENMFDKIKDYKVYEKTTIVFFSDGTKETVVCCDEDTFDVEQGIIMCVIKRMFGDKYKKYVKSIIKAKTLNEENVKKLEAAHKEAQLREERKEKRNRENKLRMKARYEARLAVAIEEEKKKIKENRKIKNTF
jgi:hypothetical protein